MALKACFSGMRKGAKRKAKWKIHEGSLQLAKLLCKVSPSTKHYALHLGDFKKALWRLDVDSILFGTIFFVTNDLEEVPKFEDIPTSQPHPPHLGS